MALNDNTTKLQAILDAVNASDKTATVTFTPATYGTVVSCDYISSNGLVSDTLAINSDSSIEINCVVPSILGYHSSYNIPPKLSTSGSSTILYFTGSTGYIFINEDCTLTFEGSVTGGGN